MPIGKIEDFLGEANKRKTDVRWLINVHHTLMKEYGWIPLEEFKKIPLPTIFFLMEEIYEERKEINKRTNKMQNRRKRKW